MLRFYDTVIRVSAQPAHARGDSTLWVLLICADGQIRPFIEPSSGSSGIKTILL